MAVTHTRDAIVLTGSTAKSFAEKMRNPSKEVMKKRDAFLKEARTTVIVTRKPNGMITLK